MSSQQPLRDRLHLKLQAFDLPAPLCFQCSKLLCLLRYFALRTLQFLFFCEQHFGPSSVQISFPLYPCLQFLYRVLIHFLTTLNVPPMTAVCSPGFPLCNCRQLRPPGSFSLGLFPALLCSMSDFPCK